MRIDFLNIQVDNVSMDEAVNKLDLLIQRKEHSYIVTPNMDHIVLVEKDELFKKIYSEASLVLTDGMPLLWISKLLGCPIKEKVSGSDFFPEICKLAMEKGYKLFLLGGAAGVAEKAASNLVNKYHGLNIVGTYSPPFGFENDPIELKKIVALINNSETDILAVALGSPKGEKFIYKILSDIHASVSISIGATIDFEAGEVRRAPEWISKIGFEWLFRITQDPKRLARRYLKDAVSIVPIILKYRKR